jgi:hypothetical protein
MDESIETGEIEFIKCILCNCDLNNEVDTITTPCNHNFHKECIDRYLANISRLHNTRCPMCDFIIRRRIKPVSIFVDARDDETISVNRQHHWDSNETISFIFFFAVISLLIIVLLLVRFH